MPGDLERLRSVWERAARTDPHFAICSDPSKRGTWASEEFFLSGEQEVEVLFDYLSQHGRTLDAPVLDFGCGLGRLTRALASRSGSALGLDLSVAMVDQARTLHESVPGCEFRVNAEPDLALFRDDQFGGVYSNIVLQHMPRALAERYIAEFVRVTRPGGTIVFQVPSEFRTTWVARVRSTLRLRTRIREILGDETLAHGRVEWEMHAIPQADVTACVLAAGGVVEDVVYTNATHADFNGDLKFLSAPQAQGWVSRQYLVTVP